MAMEPIAETAGAGEAAASNVDHLVPDPDASATTETLAPAIAVEAGPPPGWFGRTFDSLHDSNFRQLYFGNILQFGSMQMQLVVRGWLVFHLTGSFAALGTMSLANAIPGLLFSPVGGVIADRAPKKTVIQLAQMYNVLNA